MNNININNLEQDLQDNILVQSTLNRVKEINAIVDRDILPNDFEVDEEGVWYLQKKQHELPSRIWISSPLWVTAYTRDYRGENHGRILEFKDAVDGQVHSWTMPMELLASDGTKIIAMLLNMGLRITPNKKSKEHLLEYITLCQPCKRARCVLQTGWFNGVFVLPSETIGFLQNEKITYQNSTCFETVVDVLGTLKEWQLNIAKKASGNSRLIFAISASFTGPLLHLMNHENIGIHFNGNSSLGKSTAGFVANSVWGSKKNIHTFRATANGLEGLASLYNDRLLCLDELGQICANDAGQVIYMLGNGMGKGRATQQGLAKKRATWSQVFLSNGELTLAQLLQEVGKRVKAGQEVRLIEIAADTGVYGLFENLHEFESGSDFSDYLKDVCSKFYGTASREFLKLFVEDVEGAITRVKAVIEGARQRYLPKHVSSQVTRVFNHFALIAGAGELATYFGITGWSLEEAMQGVMKCFAVWLETRGSSGMQEEQEVLHRVKTFFQFNGESRFSTWSNDPVDEGRTIKRVGYRRRTENGEVEFYVYPLAFRGEICAGLDHVYAAKVCIKHKLLVPDSEGAATRPERLPGKKETIRCYRFTSEVLSG